MDAESVVTRLIESWERLDRDAIAACLAEDAVWHNMPFAPITGRNDIVAAISRFLDGVEHAAFRVHHSGELKPGLVMNERNDVFRLKDGRTIDIPVAGVFEVTDGRISAWRDYFDGATMNP